MISALLERVERTVGRVHARARRGIDTVRRDRRRRRRQPPGDLPGWFAELSDGYVAAALGGSGLPVGLFAEAAFVQHETANPVRRLVPRSAPRPFVDLAEAACFPPLDDPFDLDVWRDAQLRYRAAHESSTVALFAEPTESMPAVEVVCVTNRPSRLQNVVANFREQRWPAKRLVLVLNGEASRRLDDAEIGALAPEATVMRFEDLTLGGCLNRALESSDERFVAKVDDDDTYGPHYLGDLLIAHRYAGAGVVGKHSCFAYLEQSDSTIVRFPGAAFLFTPFLAGGTLLIDRASIRGATFPEVDLGEDQGFLRRCLLRGVSTFAADPFNYVQHRGVHNTWSISDQAYAARSVVAGNGLRLDLALV